MGHRKKLNHTDNPWKGKLYPHKFGNELSKIEGAMLQQQTLTITQLFLV